MTPEDYLLALPEERQTPMRQLRKVILVRLPDHFEEEMSYGMIGYVVPHSVYAPGYHCDPKLPLPFMSIASQKGHIGFYHMGLYADESLMNWFQQEFPKHSTRKLDVGKSCIRFKNPEHIPFELIGDLVSRMSAEEWIRIYEDKFKR